MSKKLLSTLFVAIIVAALVCVSSVHAAARQSDVDRDGVPDAADPETIVSANVTLRAGAYMFKNLTISNNAVLTLTAGTSPDECRGVCITADNIIVEEGSSLYIDSIGYVTGQDLAAGVTSIDTVNGRQVVTLSVGSDCSAQSVTDYPEQIRGASEGCLALVPEDMSSGELHIVMDVDSEFIIKLMGFGLSEKEAQLYVHLLKYGPKPPSLLAKSLKTYREDVYRTLTGLIDKDMVSPSLETPMVYAAVDLDIALDTALKKRESELHELEKRKRELQEISKQQRLRPSDEFHAFKILKSVKDVLAVAIPLLNSLKKEFLGCINEPAMVAASLYGINDTCKKLIDRGGKVRGITDLSHSTMEIAQQQLDIGMEMRHFEQYRGILFVVFDRQSSISAISADIRHVSLNEPLLALWSDDPTYAEYLASIFEMLWEQSIPAAQWIEELLKGGHLDV
jgi:sugar-specific transcriptional regulator TrmB